jgi:hypothetical protein
MRYEDVPTEEIDIPDPELTVDQDARRRALLHAMKEPGRADQLYAYLEEGEEGAAHACALAVFIMQTKNLNLKPWQNPPSEIGTPGVTVDPKIMAIGDRLLKAGLSLQEPHPLQALAKAEKLKS